MADDTVVVADEAKTEAQVEQAVVTQEAYPKPELVEDLSSLSNKLTVEDLAKMDATDPVGAAAIRSQLNWARDSKVLFKEESAEEKARKQLLSDMDARDAEEAQKRREDETAKAKADELAKIDQLIQEQRAKFDDLTDQAKACEAEIKRLNALKKAG